MGNGGLFIMEEIGKVTLENHFVLHESHVASPETEPVAPWCADVS
jgi:hypothetical protein